MPESEAIAVYGYLTQPEIRFLDAAVERLIPTDELGPGGRDAGVTCYIDRQLSSTWGTHGRNYRSGPWLEGTPEQGFQSRLTPQEIYRIGIHEINLYCKTQFEKPFDQLAPAKQDEILKGLEEGTLELPSLSSKLFFTLFQFGDVDKCDHHTFDAVLHGADVIHRDGRVDFVDRTRDGAGGSRRIR